MIMKKLLLLLLVVAKFCAKHPTATVAKSKQGRLAAVVGAMVGAAVGQEKLGQGLLAPFLKLHSKKICVARAQGPQQVSKAGQMAFC